MLFLIKGGFGVCSFHSVLYSLLVCHVQFVLTAKYLYLQEFDWTYQDLGVLCEIGDIRKLWL